MNKDDNTTERRLHKRYQIEEGIFSALPSHSKVAKIENISRGGVAFTCFSYDEQYLGPPKIEIFSKNNEFYLKEIPFKIVSEIELENHVPFSSLQKKRFCGKFIELTENQKYQLDCFINTFTTAKIDFKILNSRAVGKNATRLDNGGRRSGGDRRVFSYDIHLPERRSDTFRRGGLDRRGETYHHRNYIEQRKTFN